MSEEFEVDKIAKKKNKELERAMKLRSNEDLIDSVNRISAMEFEQENPVKVKIKKKPKPDKGFPDFSGDGKITQKDILMGKGVIPKVKDMKMGGPVKANKKTSFRGQYDIQTKKVKFKGIF